MINKIRSLWKDMKIKVNKAQCRSCGDTIESKHRHDFVRCSCGSIFVDGGKEYLKRGGNPDDLVDLSKYEDESTYERKMKDKEFKEKYKDVYVKTVADNLTKAEIRYLKSLLNLSKNSIDDALESRMFPPSKEELKYYGKELKLINSCLDKLKVLSTLKS